MHLKLRLINDEGMPKRYRSQLKDLPIGKAGKFEQVVLDDSSKYEIKSCESILI